MFKLVLSKCQCLDGYVNNSIRLILKFFGCVYVLERYFTKLNNMSHKVSFMYNLLLGILLCKCSQILFVKLMHYDFFIDFNNLLFLYIGF